MMLRIFHASVLLIAAMVLYGCAQESSPTGGEKDEIPPQPVLITPPPLTLEFTESRFEITFDEYVQIDDFTGQLLVSPPLKRRPEYRLRGKKLTVTWDSRLELNTTYQFNFGEAVKDYNEGNVNDKLIYVFSTGNYIDSMTVTGKVIDAFTNEPVPKVRVMLYRGYNDSLVYTTPPDYVAVTNAEGKYTARYLSPDTFMVVALEEKSSNYKYDGPPERIGFLDYLVLSTHLDTAFAHTFALFEEADTSQYLKSGKGKDYGYYEAVYNVPVSNPSIRFFEDAYNELTAISLLSGGRDTLRSWVDIKEKPDLEEIIVIASDGLGFVDTTSWYIETDRKYREKAKLSVSASSAGGMIDPRKPVVLYFNHPLERADTTLIALYADSLEVSPQRMNLTQHSRRLEVYHPYSREVNYQLVLRAGAFKDLYGNFSDSLNFSFGLHPDDYYGSLKVKVMLDDTVSSGHFLAELFDSKKNLAAWHLLTHSGQLNFGKLSPGKYTLTGIFDENDNGEWDTGQYLKLIQPERRVVFSGEINIRSNWDLEVDWIPSTPFDH